MPTLVTLFLLVVLSSFLLPFPVFVGYVFCLGGWWLLLERSRRRGALRKLKFIACNTNLDWHCVRVHYDSCGWEYHLKTQNGGVLLAYTIHERQELFLLVSREAVLGAGFTDGLLESIQENYKKRKPALSTDDWVYALRIRVMWAIRKVEKMHMRPG